jgi:hypothetical protein
MFSGVFVARRKTDNCSSSYPLITLRCHDVLRVCVCMCVCVCHCVCVRARVVRVCSVRVWCVHVRACVCRGGGGGDMCIISYECITQ